MNIHLIEREKRFQSIDKNTHSWESGYWAVKQETAEALIGGRIHFHRTQDAPSYFGGEITGIKIVAEGEWEGRVVFQFKADLEGKGVRTAREGWSMEKKIEA